MKNINTETSKLYSLLTATESLIVRRFELQLEELFANVPESQSGIKELIVLQLMIKTAKLYRAEGIKVVDLNHFKNLSPQAARLSALRGVYSALLADALPDFNPKVASFLGTHVECVATSAYLLTVYAYKVDV